MTAAVPAADWRLPAAVALVAFLPRAAAALLWPAGGGDWEIYGTVAENILAGCGVSLSDPAGSACRPHFGGNSLPGYPAFVAAVWSLSGHSDVAVRLVQAACYAGALAWLVAAVRRAVGSPAAALAVGLVMALSPLQVAWPRFTQTETLALATTVWVLAELTWSLHQGRLRLLPLAVALAVAVFIRLDGVLLTVPVAVLAFHLHRPVQAVRRGIVVALLMAVPLAGWTARNVAVGLPSVLPPTMVTPDGGPAPRGYMAWGDTWVTEEYQRPGYLWPVTRFVYDAIAVDPAAYDDAAEADRVAALLAELKTHQGRPIPPHIDAAFAALAAERAARAPWRTHVGNPLKRAAALWSNPFASFGWPSELPGTVAADMRLDIARGDVATVLDAARQYPGKAAAKAMTAGYRVALMLAALGALALAFTTRLGPARIFVWLALSHVLARTVLLALTNNVETRYTVEAVPAMELAVVLALWSLRRGRLERPAPAA